MWSHPAEGHLNNKYTGKLLGGPRLSVVEIFMPLIGGTAEDMTVKVEREYHRYNRGVARDRNAVCELSLI